MILRSLLFAGALAAAAPALAADSGNRFAPKGVGLINCEQFLKGLQERQENVLVVAGWLEGYLSAVNQFSPETFDIAPWQGTESLIGLVRLNCERNKEARFFDVVNSMVGFLRDGRLKESTQRIVAESGDKKVSVYQSTMRDLQQALAKRGLLDGNADGQFGPKTKAAIEEFQKSQQIEVTGLPDQQTLWRLLAPSEGGSSTDKPAADKPAAEKKPAAKEKKPAN